MTGAVVDLIHSAALLGLGLAWLSQSRTLDVLIRRVFRADDE